MTEKNKQLLQELEKEGVKFLPWIGDKYDEGIYYDEEGELQNDSNSSGKGKKVLVLGESFYWGEEDDDGNAKNFISKVINDFIDPNSEFRHYERTFIKFERAMYGRKLNDEKKESQKFWNHVIFYNYVQEPLKKARMFPTQEQYEKSAKYFCSLLKVCQPDFIIAWGIRLYNNLPSEEVIEGEMGGYVKIDDDFYEVWNYNINGRIFPILGIYHPSAAFDWQYWHRVIKKFFDYGK